MWIFYLFLLIVKLFKTNRYTFGNNYLVYIYIYIYIRGAFNKFQDFLIQAFEVDVDSWNFTMLLLYILWDDWLIFMISGSKERLLQELEHTLLNKAWLSQLVNFKNAIWHFRRTICNKILGLNATETYGMFQIAFGPSCMNWAFVFEWHKRFKEAREFGRDDEWCGRSKEVNIPELIGQRVAVRVRVTMLRF